jgi:hypothetical protein
MHTAADILIYRHPPRERTTSALTTPPSPPNRAGNNAGQFRPSNPAAAPPVRPDATGPTLRLTDIRQKLEQRARGQRTRRTVDLSPATHRALDLWQREAADRLGLSRVTGQEVLNALIEQLVNDPKLSAQITRSIHERR